MANVAAAPAAEYHPFDLRQSNSTTTENQAYEKLQSATPLEVEYPPVADGDGFASLL
jgi:hypothetical protein